VIRAQDYMFGRPMPEHELTATLTATIDHIRWRAAKPLAASGPVERPTRLSPADADWWSRPPEQPSCC
jgi:hypothetical protein